MSIIKLTQQHLYNRLEGIPVEYIDTVAFNRASGSLTQFTNGFYFIIEDFRENQNQLDVFTVRGSLIRYFNYEEDTSMFTRLMIDGLTPLVMVNRGNSYSVKGLMCLYRVFTLSIQAPTQGGDVIITKVDL